MQNKNTGMVIAIIVGIVLVVLLLGGVVGIMVSGFSMNSEMLSGIGVPTYPKEPVVAQAGGSPYEKVEKKSYGNIYYLSCQQAQTFEGVAGAYDAAMDYLGSKGPTAWKIGLKIPEFLGFTNVNAENVRKANYTDPVNRQGCRGIRIGEAKVGPFTVALLVGPR